MREGVTLFGANCYRMTKSGAAGLWLAGLWIALECLTYGISHAQEIPIGPFKKYHGGPILLPQGTGFETKAVFNPTAIVVNDTIFMFYRAEDWRGQRRWNGTSTIGMAYSTDGIHFTRHPKPVITPEHDYETPGGCEDPRIVNVDDLYCLTYTAYNGKTARLALAISKDLVTWEKKGIIIPWEWTKAGAISPQKINEKYVMYFGDKSIWIAHSDNLIDWIVDENPVLEPREGHFDNRIVEPGPPPIILDEGILLIYNGSNKEIHYEPGWVLFSKNDPRKILARSKKPILSLSKDWEKYGQVPNVIFAEGLVKYKDIWYLYYGAADTYVGLAMSKK